MNLANVYLATKDTEGVEKFARCEGSEELVAVLGNPLLISRYRAAKREKAGTTCCGDPMKLDTFGAVFS
jgi:hypothetical protein